MAENAAPPNDAQNEWFLPEKNRQQLTELFAELVHPVNIHIFTLPGAGDVFNDFLIHFARDLARVSDKILPHYHTIGDEMSQSKGVSHSPTLLIEPERYSIGFLGAPLGEEGRSFVEAVLMASKRDSGLSPASREILADLEEPRLVQVFVSPTCPYCPPQVVNAFRAAVERPGLVEAWCVETSQAPALAEQNKVGSVPHTLFAGKLAVVGQEPEARFMAELVTLEEVESLFGKPHFAPGETVSVDLLILGGGPTGLTAGIYAGRAGLKTLVLEKTAIGGQVSLTPVVENYPGFRSVPGVALMEMTAAQARQYCTILLDEVLQLSAGPAGIKARTASVNIEARALLLATGAKWKQLGAVGEKEFFGRGVNYCATCDGYLYKGKTALVVGGGNTALTDALYLKNLGVDVALVHRRKEFRAEKHLQESLARESIATHTPCVVEAILGEEKVRAVRLRDLDTGVTREVKTDGLFVAIGEAANSEAAARLGCELTEAGDVVVDAGMRTNVPGVYAAGDVTGGVRQIVTAVGQGATAALSIFEDLARQNS
ncbi:FAD-dependent oxidoreductase [Fundidesulfovibrio butyratiphilus]